MYYSSTADISQHTDKTKMKYSRFVLAILVLIGAVHSLGESCTSSADCSATECCVSLERRMRRFIFGSSKGSCHPRRYQGQACHVFLVHDFGNPDMYMNYCPCEEGLVCRGDTVDVHGNQHVHHNPKCIPAGEATTAQAQNSPGSTFPPSHPEVISGGF